MELAGCRVWCPCNGGGKGGLEDSLGDVIRLILHRMLNSAQGTSYFYVAATGYRPARNETSPGVIVDGCISKWNM